MTRSHTIQPGKTQQTQPSLNQRTAHPAGIALPQPNKTHESIRQNLIPGRIGPLADPVSGIEPQRRKRRLHRV